MSVRCAAIDIGTVTTRLLVADVDELGVREIVRRSVITQLGDGWTRTGELSAAGIERVASTVASFLREARSLDVQTVHAVATSASRDAGNSDDFLARLAAVGCEPRIISGDEEAALTFLGATFELGSPDTLVVDVGGGSTELVLGSPGPRGACIRCARSFDVGSKRVTELDLRSDPPTGHEVARAMSRIRRTIGDFIARLPVPPRQMIAVAGTATSLAAIHQGLEPYDPGRVHGYRLPLDAIAGMREHLASLPLAERQHVRGLEPERAGVIVAGTLILEVALSLAGLDSTLVSEHDILYGILLAHCGGAAGGEGT